MSAQFYERNLLWKRRAQRKVQALRKALHHEDDDADATPHDAAVSNVNTNTNGGPSNDERVHPVSATARNTHRVHPRTSLARAARREATAAKRHLRRLSQGRSIRSRAKEAVLRRSIEADATAEPTAPAPSWLAHTAAPSFFESGAYRCAATSSGAPTQVTRMKRKRTRQRSTASVRREAPPPAASAHSAEVVSSPGVDSAATPCALALLQNSPQDIAPARFARNKQHVRDVLALNAAIAKEAAKCEQNRFELIATRSQLWRASESEVSSVSGASASASASVGSTTREAPSTGAGVATPSSPSPAPPAPSFATAPPSPAASSSTGLSEDSLLSAGVPVSHDGAFGTGPVSPSVSSASRLLLSGAGDGGTNDTCVTDTSHMSQLERLEVLNRLLT